MSKEPKLQFRTKGDTNWQDFPELPTVDFYDKKFPIAFLINYGYDKDVASESDMITFINGEISEEEFRKRGHDFPAMWKVEDERDRLRQVIINKATTNFFTDLFSGRIEIRNLALAPESNKTETCTNLREEKLESALKLLLDVTLLEVSCFEQSETYRICDEALTAECSEAVSKDKDDLQKRTYTLLQEARESVVRLLMENNLTELELLTDPDKDSVVWVIWSDDSDDFYNSIVTKVCLDEGGISIEVEHPDNRCVYTLDHNDLACQHIDWLCQLKGCIIETLKSQNDE